MAELILHGKTVRTVFNLLGTKENDLSYSLGWALSQCPPFMASVVKAFSGQRLDTQGVKGIEVRLQEHDKADRGYTDVEIIIPGHCYLIIEMKRGWNLPGPAQLARYADRPGLLDKSYPERRLITLSECSPEYAERNCPPSINARTNRTDRAERIVQIISPTTCR